jgi:formate-dependent nitrite reductase cytochrome c552 subunit
MAKKRTKIPKEIENRVLSLSNNRCCVCQTPFIQFHHIDEDPSNNKIENIAPLCPNCHTQAHSNAKMTVNLSPERIISLRDKWYDYCQNRKDGSNISVNALLKLKNLIRPLGLADHSWAKTFATVDPSYGDMTREEILDRIFSTSNRDDLITALDTIQGMYSSKFVDGEILNKFKKVCNAFGIDYDEL